MSKEIIIDVRSAKVFELEKGQKIRIDQTLGPQLAGLVAFNRDNLSEKFSQGNTQLSLAFGPFKRKSNSGKVTYWIEKGDTLVSNRWQEMMTVEEDTFKKHDITFDLCDSFFNGEILGLGKGYPGCRELHTEELKPWGISSDDISAGINLFQNTNYAPDGISVSPTVSEENDFVLLLATMDILVSVTSCPFPLGENRPVRIEIL